MDNVVDAVEIPRRTTGRAKAKAPHRSGGVTASWAERAADGLAPIVRTKSGRAAEACAQVDCTGCGILHRVDWRKKGRFPLFEADLSCASGPHMQQYG